MKIYKVLLSFPRTVQPSKAIAPQSNSSLLTPIMTYGAKTTTLTKINRSAYRRYERRIIHDMMETTHDYTNESIDELLPRIPTQFILFSSNPARTVTRRIRATRMRYWGHIKRRSQNYILQLALRYTLPGNKKRGRPCITWNNSQEDDLGKYGEEVNFWKDMSNDKTE
jgi:hypothetical protein